MGYTKMNSDSCVSEISFRFQHELEMILALDGKVRCLGGVYMKGCGLKGRQNGRASGGGNDI